MFCSCQDAPGAVAGVAISDFASPSARGSTPTMDAEDMMQAPWADDSVDQTAADEDKNDDKDNDDNTVAPENTSTCITGCGRPRANVPWLPKQTYAQVQPSHQPAIETRSCAPNMIEVPQQKCSFVSD
jgi:hypothetical protein